MKGILSNKMNFMSSILSNKIKFLSSILSNKINFVIINIFNKMKLLFPKMNQMYQQSNIIKAKDVKIK